MTRLVRRAILWGAVFVALACAVILVNQVLQLSEFAGQVDPTLGEAVFWGISMILALSLLVPALLILRLPRPLIPPVDPSGSEFDDHIRRLSRRLRKNPRLRDRSIASREELDQALAILDRHATDIVKISGRRAFLTTAISQNGALDSLIVLGIQAKLVWDVSHVYLQRPTVRDLTYLYSNVVVTAFLAGEIDDADLSETIQPVLTTVLGSAVSVVPGLQVASSVFVNSVINGSANAFLTLRVGVIAQEYSRAVARPERRILRRVAIARAAGMLGVVAASSAAKVSAAIARASGRKVTGTITGAGRRMRTTGSALKDRLGFDNDEELATEGDSGTGPP